MNKDDLSLNNKFGQCCDCPALMSDKGRMFTNYVSSRLYNDSYSKFLKVPDAHSYRNKLQEEGNLFRSIEVYRFDKAKCKSDGKTKALFYIDSSNYTFDKPLTDAYWGQKIQNDGKYKKIDRGIF